MTAKQTAEAQADALCALVADDTELGRLQEAPDAQVRDRVADLLRKAGGLDALELCVAALRETKCPRCDGTGLWSGYGCLDCFKAREALAALDGPPVTAPVMEAATKTVAD